MITEFLAEHQSFYQEFDPWRKEKRKMNLPNSGVYELISNRAIGRFMNIDNQGTMYIGRGDILSNNNRIGKFINALNNNEDRHDGGMRYNLSLIREKYPLGESIVRITLTNDAELLERQKLEEYIQKFGELPPLNRILG